MKLYPKKNDDEYIAAIRKNVARSRALGIFHGVAAVFFVAMLYFWHRLGGEYQRLFPEYAPGIGAGIAIGMGAALVVVFAVQAASWSLRSFYGQRTERLLLRFHDQVKNMNRDFQQADGQVVSEGAPSASSEKPSS